MKLKQVVPIVPLGKPVGAAEHQVLDAVNGSYLLAVAAYFEQQLSRLQLSLPLPLLSGSRIPLLLADAAFPVAVGVEDGSASATAFSADAAVELDAKGHETAHEQFLQVFESFLEIAAEKKENCLQC